MVEGKLEGMVEGEQEGMNGRREAGGTVDGERHLPLPRAHPRHHGSAHVFPRVFLADRLQDQLVLIAQDLKERRGGFQVGHKELQAKQMT